MLLFILMILFRVDAILCNETTLAVGNHVYTLSPDPEVHGVYHALGPDWAICFLDDNHTLEFAVWSQNDTVGEWPLRERNRTGDVTPGPRQVSSHRIHEFFPGCFKGDENVHVLNITLVLDDTMKSVSRRDLEKLVSVARIAFLSQIRISIRIQDIEFISGMPSSAIGAFDPFGLAASPKWKSTAYRMLISNAYSGITGVAYVGSICSSLNFGVSNNDWLDFAHEFGHAIGAVHTFGKGGIMDYADGKYDGDVQMHPDLRPSVCPFLAYTLPTCVGHVGLAKTGCGDGVLSKGEECECTEFGLRKCGACVECKLLRVPECSVDFYIPNRPLAHPKCCASIKIAGPKKECAPGHACGPHGECVSACARGFGIRTKTCGFDRMGCNQGCVFNGKCRWDITVDNQRVSEMKNGTRCLGGGTCSGGTCSSKPCPIFKSRSTCPRSYCKWTRGRCVHNVR